MEPATIGRARGELWTVYLTNAASASASTLKHLLAIVLLAPGRLPPLQLVFTDSRPALPVICGGALGIPR